jgi:hypothetical protein
MKPSFIAHHRTIAKRKAQVFGVLFVSMSVLTAAGVHLLWAPTLFDNIVGIMLLSIGGVGLPWSAIGALWSLGDMRD